MKIQVIIAALILVTLTNCKRRDPLWRTISYNNELEQALSGSFSASDNWLMALKQRVKKNGNRREGLESAKRAELLKMRTAELLGEIQKVKTFVQRERGDGFDVKTGTLKKPLANSKINKQVEGLRKKLKKYVNFLKAEYKDLDLEFLDKDQLSAEEVQDEKRFYDVYFRGTSVIEALMSLTHLQFQAMDYERAVAVQLGRRRSTR